MNRYSEVYNHFIERIKNGVLKEGEFIPKEIDISAAFGVSRPTVRHALDKLVNEGYLKRIKGKGSYVTKPKILQEYTKFIESYNDEMIKKGLTPVTKVLEMGIAYPNKVVQKNLDMGADDRIVKLQRLRLIQQENGACKPIILTTVYFRLALMPDVFQYDFEQKSFYAVLAEHHIKINKAARVLEIKPLNEKQAKLFGLAENEPSHFISSIGYQDEKPIEYSENYYPSDRNKFIIEIAR